MTKRTFSLLSTTLLFFFSIPLQLAAQGNSALGWIQDLVGTWEGTSEWSGARTGSGNMSANYYLTGNGSAIVENLMIDAKPVMTTVYHLDGRNLRMTHYCAAQNQPRLEATSIHSENRKIVFDFVDITNLPDPEAGHVRKLEMNLMDANHITLRFTFVGNGKESYELVSLTRIRASDP